MTLYFRDEGQGVPLVLIHGLGASSRVFDPLFEQRGKRRLISVDLPRTARSDHWAPCTPEGVATALLPFLSSRDVNEFELFGHSFGGLIALQLASIAIERVKRLTVASAPAFGLPARLKPLVLHRWADHAMGNLGRLPAWRPAIRAYLKLIWGDSSPIEETNIKTYAEAVRAQGFYDGMLEALRSIADFRLPVEQLAHASFQRHVIWGEQDRLVPVIQGEQLAGALNAPLTVLRAVGHCVPEESPQELLQCLSAGSTS